MTLYLLKLSIGEVGHEQEMATLMACRGHENHS